MWDNIPYILLIPKNLHFSKVNSIFKIMTKAANVFEKLKEFAENRVEDFAYGGYLVRHKYNVLKGGLELGHPIWPLLKHDWSKFKPNQWVPYREKFYGQNTSENQQLFRKAVQDHVNSETHHDYKYKPEKNVKITAENKADWWAIQREQHPETTPSSIKEWLKKKKKS